ncbi:MAG TPA: phage tail sheath subtilisin-like domain-containing protein, partial [Pyrinomonadaceae bacterium]|nr:phage tail sheath subtilisin-like domain-containing protein [Pyrinomonadaceae bacterium]
GNIVVTIAIRLHENLLAGETGKLTAAGLTNYDTVWISKAALQDSSGHGGFYRALFSEPEQTWSFGKAATGHKPDNIDWRLNTSASSGFRSLSRVADDPLAQVRVATVTISVASPDGGTYVWDRIAPDSDYTNAQGPNSLSSCFGEKLEGIRARVLPLVVLVGEELATGVDVVETILSGVGSGEPADTAQFERLDWLDDDTFSLRRTAELSGGNDGQLPGVEEYLGRATEEDDWRTGLSALEFVDEVSIVAAPGATAGYLNNSDRANAIIAGLVAHAERLRHRIAVIDSGDKQTMPEVRAMRGLIDSKHAAFYYPWIRVLDPLTQKEISLPPSGIVAGIYARVDRERGVFKAPANEVVHGATGLEVILDDARQEILNREGINCFRFFPDRGFRLFGARLASSDPEFKYVNVRRYIAYLEHSIDRGTQWAVFEPNGEILWANVRAAIEDFLLLEWRSGALMGVKPEEAYFVKCDRSTMTQADIESGRLICLIGIATVRPAEFVIFRIGQWTASRPDP